ncbi:MAG: hypothetical protein ACU84Q_06660 [Gammaproteobacteria bacterium]
MTEQALSPLKLVIDNSSKLAPIENLLDEYTDEFEVQRAQLLDDLNYFQTKLRELEMLDPLDYTGLTETYREHERRISAILGELRDPQALEA